MNAQGRCERGFSMNLEDRLTATRSITWGPIGTDGRQRVWSTLYLLVDPLAGLSQLVWIRPVGILHSLFGFMVVLVFVRSSISEGIE